MSVKCSIESSESLGSQIWRSFRRKGCPVGFS